MSYIVAILSLILDGILSFFLNNNLIFNSLFTLTSLIIIFRYYRRKGDIKYLICCGILGLLYDIIYTDTIFLNVGIYLIIGVLVIKYFKLFSYNLLNSLLLLMIIIFLYRLLTFIVLSNVEIIKLDFNKLFKSFYSSLILNIFYITSFFLKRKKYKKYLKA